jgi:hypothetical protein
MWGGSSDSEYRVRAFSRHSSRALSLRKAEFSQDIQGIGARLLENPKFVSWARIRARLGKSQVQGPIMCPLVDGLMICNWVIYIRVFEFFVPYILYYISISTEFLFRVYLPFHVIHIGVFSNVHKIVLDLYIFNIMHLKYSIGIWVQSMKEDQILRLDLNPYWIIFKLLTFPRWLWDPDIFRFGILLEWVLGTVLRDDRDASLHLHVSRVVG